MRKTTGRKPPRRAPPLARPAPACAGWSTTSPPHRVFLLSSGPPFPPRTLSADRRCVDDAAIPPQCVETARNVERRARADIALEHLAIVADRRDRVRGPFAGEAERFAISALATEQALDFRVGACGHLRHIDRGDAKFLRVDERKQRPANNV